MNEEKIAATFSIKKIKEFYFVVNEAISEPNNPVLVQFQHITRFFADTNLIDLTLRVYYTHDSNIPPKNILVDLHVQNIFEVENLKQYSVDGSEFILPRNLIVLMVSLSISHSRALIAKNIAGTIYQENILPLANPSDVARVFYPNMFLEQENHAVNKEKTKREKNQKKKTE